MTQPYTYTSREYDPETGLSYYRARYYDARVGRFLQEDPIWDVNLYSYAGNNPVNWVDPWGLFERGTPEWEKTYQGVKDHLMKKYKDLKEKGECIPITLPGKTAEESIDEYAKEFADAATKKEYGWFGEGLLNPKNQKTVNDKVKQNNPDWPWKELEDASKELFK